MHTPTPTHTHTHTHGSSLSVDIHADRETLSLLHSLLYIWSHSRTHGEIYIGQWVTRMRGVSDSNAWSEWLKMRVVYFNSKSGCVNQASQQRSTPHPPSVSGLPGQVSSHPAGECPIVIPDTRPVNKIQLSVVTPLGSRLCAWLVFLSSTWPKYHCLPHSNSSITAKAMQSRY